MALTKEFRWVLLISYFLVPIVNPTPSWRHRSHFIGLFNRLRHQHQDRKPSEQTTQSNTYLNRGFMNFVYNLVPEDFRDPMVVFSVNKPKFPPGHKHELVESSPEYPSSNERRLDFTKNGSLLITSKLGTIRNVPNPKQFRQLLSTGGQKISVCDSVTDWVAKVTSEDIHGNQVTILQEIDIGGARVNQYFYETRCVASPDPGLSGCRGIDTEQYHSTCLEKFMWAYAKVQNSHGDRGWTNIKVGASCSCAIQEREHYGK